MTKIRDTTEPLPVTQIVTKAKEIGMVTKEQQKTNDQFGFFCLFVFLHNLSLLTTHKHFLVVSDLSRTYTQDGVCLTESGLCQLQSLSATASRRRKPKPKLKLKIINQNSVAVLQAPVDPLSELSRDEDMEDNRGTCLHRSVFIFRWLSKVLTLLSHFLYLSTYICTYICKYVAAGWCFVYFWLCRIKEKKY